MANKATPRANQPVELPPGIELTHELDCGAGRLWNIAFNTDGTLLGSASDSGTVRIWRVDDGQLLQLLTHGNARSVAFHPNGGTVATGGFEIKLWAVQSGELIRSFKHQGNWVVDLNFEPGRPVLASAGFNNSVNLWSQTGAVLQTFGGHEGWVWAVAFSSDGALLADASSDRTIRIWRVENGELLHTLKSHGWRVYCVAFHPSNQILASGSGDSTVKLWDPQAGKLLRTLEGHTDEVTDVAFSADARLLASKSNDETIRLWCCDTWETIAIIGERADASWARSGLAFHPTLPLLAAAGGEKSNRVHLWKLDFEKLLSQRAGPAAAVDAVHHATAKIVLVGDHSVGKSGLAYRLIHGRFKEQLSTHGQQFWIFPDLGQQRTDGTDCEAILWDLAGQPDYRLVHALFVDNADLALVLFDAADLRDPMRGVAFWLKQLQAAKSGCPVILVPAQIDRGTSPLTRDELEAFCRREGIAGPIPTSAYTGEGIAELIECMKSKIAWDDKPATVTTATFKKIKDYVLSLKESGSRGQSLVTLDELRERLERLDADWRFTDAEIVAAVGHLENYGYVKRLKTSKGEQRILLQPELLNNLASSFVLKARGHEKGLGALEERRLLAGGYDFPELSHLEKTESETLLDSAALLFLEHHVCFRETDPLRMEPYLVFPELINLKKPPDDEPATEDGVAYTLVGPTENVFASLVVLLGYTHTFTRTAQWHENARYEVGDKLICAFRQEGERDGELDLVLSFGPNVGLPVRTLFQGLFESFLARRNLTVVRYEPVRCTQPGCGCLVERSVVRRRLNEGKSFTHCDECGEKLVLPPMAEPIQLSREVQVEVEAQRLVAEQRTCFEQAIFRVGAYMTEQSIAPPETFVSYAWGDPAHERWVERRLASDLQKAGINVLLDRWHNAQIGANVARFVERIEQADRIVIVGTPTYRRKYENRDSETGYVVAAEVDVIANRLVGTEAQKRSVLPILLDGEKAESLPPLLHGRVYADFRNELSYFAAAFELILSLYQISPNDPVTAELRDSLAARELKVAAAGRSASAA